VTKQILCLMHGFCVFQFEYLVFAYNQVYKYPLFKVPGYLFTFFECVWKLVLVVEIVPLEIEIK
jgi:hypothetical protein